MLVNGKAVWRLAAITIFIALWLLGAVNCCLGETCLDVPYRNQVIDFSDWTNNWASCGYTCTIMSLLYNNAIPANVTERELIEDLYYNCSTTTRDGYVIFYYEKVDDYCDSYLSEYDLKVDIIRNNFAENIQKSIDEGFPVIVGTYIFGDAGHVILIVGYDDNNWIVHDPANSWGQEYWPPGGIVWQNAAYTRYPKGSFTMLYGTVIKSDFNRDYATRIYDKSPTVILDQTNDYAMLWVILENTGKKEWNQKKVKLGTYYPADRSCGLRANNHSESFRWLSDNRIAMEQEKVAPGNHALFGIPIKKNGQEGIFQESFRLVVDDDDGCWFGPIVSWNIECREKRLDSGSTVNETSKENPIRYIKGSIHNHSNWSDGLYDIKDLTDKARNINLDYLVITDHSDYFDSQEKLINYVKEIDNANAGNPDICLVAGMEYTILNINKHIYPAKESFVHVIGLGYNKDKNFQPPDWFPWSEEGKYVETNELIDWHIQRGYPVIVCHPVIRGKNGIAASDLIQKCQFAGIEKASLVEFFDIGYDADVVTGSNLIKIFNPNIESNYMQKLYADLLLPAGIGVSACSDYHGLITFNLPEQTKTYLGGRLFAVWNENDELKLYNEGDQQIGNVPNEISRLMQNMDRAKTTIAVENDPCPESVCKALLNKRTVASRYHENFNYIKLNDTEIFPGIWPEITACQKNVRLEFQIQFHENSSDIQDRMKRVTISRNGIVICNKKMELDAMDRLNFRFDDNDLKLGVYSYTIMVDGCEDNDWAREKIISSPIYLEISEERITDDWTQSGNQRILSIFSEIVHLGDSAYEGDINMDFYKKEAEEGTLITKIFVLDDVDLSNVTDCSLVMKVIGAQQDQQLKRSNPILINGYKIAECTVKDESRANNNTDHFYSIPLYLLNSGRNVLQVRSLPRYTGMSLVSDSLIDFDDFEIHDARLVISYGNGTIQTSNSREISKTDSFWQIESDSEYGGDEIEQIIDGEDKELSQEMLTEFEKKGGKFLAEDSESYQLMMDIIKPIIDNQDKLMGGGPLQFKLFKSDNIDPIALPDRTILVPTGLIFENKELPQSNLFPIVTAIFQSDLGISSRQAKRKDVAGFLAGFGKILSQVSGNNICQYVGSGLAMAGAISLKVKDSDYYVADIYAIDFLDKAGIDTDFAYAFLDAAVRLEKKTPDKYQQYYILAPSAEKRLEALEKYWAVKNTSDLPIMPEYFDWEKAIKE